MRAKITQDGNTVHLEYTDPSTGERIKTSFHVAWRGGAVRNEKYQQVCEYLSGMGNTLQCEHPRFLLELIRKEYHKLYKSLKPRPSP